jgi:leucyl-tRNA synthetase
MEMPYPVRVIEEHWRRRWADAAIGIADLDAVDADRVFYNLVEFPYPSAEGLHVGHVFRYVGVDTYGRYQRMRGREVFQPIGFDAFGIHTENYAIKAGEHPRTLTERTTARFREQLSQLGACWDWARVVDTSRPEYYRWTQWLLVKMFNAGLLYRAEAPVIWCPSCLTVLAREQTENEGTTCERCDSAVTERTMTQWFLRITAYADRLLDGLDSLDWTDRSKKLQAQWIGKSDEGYRLHDWLISRQRYWGPPIPIVHCSACGTVPVPEDELPVLLPELADFRPTGDSPLANVSEWVATTCPRCGGPAERETDVSDTFLDSAWYFLRYPSTEFDDRPWDGERTRKVLPVDFYAGGSEHVQRHHLYARFVTMAMHDLGLVPFEEPIPRIRLGGLINFEGAKMSKSRGNVVSPDGYIEEHGADVLRCALLFSAPWEKGGEFSDRAVAGVERFLARCWRAVDRPDAAGDKYAADRVITAMNEAVERFVFNVAIARLMEFAGDTHSAGDKRVLVRLLAPFAPHLAEELWSRLGEPFSVHTQRWPQPRTASGGSDVEVAVQADGRLRGVIMTDAGSLQDEVAALARKEITTVPGQAETVRVIYVPGKVVNFVTR